MTDRRKTVVEDEDAAQLKFGPGEFLTGELVSAMPSRTGGMRPSFTRQRVVSSGDSLTGSCRVPRRRGSVAE